MTEKIRRGWFWPLNSKRAHYFNNEMLPLCKRYFLFAFAKVADELEDNNHDSEDNCKRCQKLHAKLPTN